jgi:hypothetical protein
MYLPDHAVRDYHYYLPTMIKNLTTNQLILIAMAAALLLVTSFSFYLLQDPTAPLPFSLPPATSTSTPPSQALAATAILNTPTPTRRTSYTPLAVFFTPAISTTAELPTSVAPPGTATASATFALTNVYPPPMPSGTIIFTSTPSSGTAVFTGTPPSGTPVSTGTPPSGTVSPTSTSNTSPTTTATLSAGEIRVTGRVIQNGTPKSHVIVSFADDVSPRQSITDAGGHYSFITLAPGTNFTLTFKQSDNPGLTPITEIASQGWIEGTLPTGVNPIDFPDLEVSINLNGMIFEPLSPVDGATYSAAGINDANPIQFSWSLYSQGGSYSIELGPNGTNQPTWVSGQLASTSFMWNGTLTDGTHIVAGNYWWRVALKKSLGNYILKLYTQLFDLSFNP